MIVKTSKQIPQKKKEKKRNDYLYTPKFWSQTPPLLSLLKKYPTINRGSLVLNNKLADGKKKAKNEDQHFALSIPIAREIGPLFPSTSSLFYNISSTIGSYELHFLFLFF